MHPPLPPNNPRTPLYVLSRRTGCRVIAYSTAHAARSSAVLYNDCCFAIENTGEAVATEMYGSLHAKL